MSTPISMNQIRPIYDLPVADIIVLEDRARELNENWVEALAKVIDAQGLTNPITVRNQDDKWFLVSGHHRLAAVKALGHEAIASRLSAAQTDDEARLEEVLENLVRNELNALDRCHHLYELKAVYEKLYPEAKQGGDRKSEKIKVSKLDFDSEQHEIFNFAEKTAEQIGLSRAAIFRCIAIWRDLSVSSRSRLNGTWIAGHQGNLKLLSEQTHTFQEKTLDLMLAESPRASSVADALMIVERGRLPDFQEKRFQALSNTLTKLKDDELDIVLNAQAERVAAWVKARGLV